MSQLVLSSDSLLASPIAGTIEYNGTAMYGTPTGTQRGVIPGMQYYKLDSNYVTANSTSAQGIFGTGSGSGLGVTLSSSTVYEFEFAFHLYKTVGTASHTISGGFAGTATINNIYYNLVYVGASAAAPFGAKGDVAVFLSTASVVWQGAQANATWSETGLLKGTVSINAGGTFIPQFTTSALTGPYSTMAGSYFKIYPIGTSGSNINVGTWA